jgi:CubicO group peptidase (beta-lactamase class C family)
MKNKKTISTYFTYTTVGRLLMIYVLIFSLSLLIIQVNCKPPTASDIPLDEKIRGIENGLFPGNGFPPWIKKSISQRMEYYNVPGVSIAVINDYKLEWAKGYGMTEAGGNKPVTVDTLFPAVGVSSTVSRFLALNFVERGIINLDEDINNKLVSWKIPGNEFTAKKKVTLRSLLRYNAAGFNEFEIKGYFKGEPLPSLRQILEGKEPANSPPVRVIAEPGVFRRAPSGNLFLVSYIVLQQLVNDVSKKPFPDAAREIILEPLGMKNSTFEQPLPRDRWHMAAAGHDADGRPVKGKWRIYPETAARGLWTTPTDMARLVIELMKSYKGQSKRFVSRDTVFNMLNPKRSYYDFNSSTGGFRCSLVFNYNTGQGIIIMMNSGSGYSLKREIQHIVFSENRWKWGYFIMRHTIFAGMLLVIAAGAMLVTIPLLGILLFLQRRKKRIKK